MAGKKFDERWRALADEALTGVSDWRAAHPKATFTEIEEEVENRLTALRSRMIEDVTQASAVSDVTALADDERPCCPDCKGRLEAHGQQKRELQTLRGVAVSLLRSYTVCQSCGTGLFPPR